jgi:hypothetical protein
MFFADLHRHHFRAAVGAIASAAAFVQGEGGIDQLPLAGGEILGAIEGARRFLAAGQRQLHRAAQRLVGFQPHHRVGPDRRHRLVIGDAASVEISILLDQRERVTGPVGAFRLDDIDVRQQQDGACLAVGAGKDGYQAALLRVTGRRKDMQLVVGVPGRLQPCRDLGGRLCAVAGGKGRVGFDQFLIKSAERGLAGVGGDRRNRRAGEQQCRDEWPDHGRSLTGWIFAASRSAKGVTSRRWHRKLHVASLPPGTMLASTGARWHQPGRQRQHPRRTREMPVG